MREAVAIALLALFSALITVGVSTFSHGAAWITAGVLGMALTVLVFLDRER